MEGVASLLCGHDTGCILMLDTTMGSLAIDYNCFVLDGFIDTHAFSASWIKNVFALPQTVHSTNMACVPALQETTLFLM